MGRSLMSRTSKRRKLAVEPLEARRLLTTIIYNDDYAAGYDHGVREYPFAANQDGFTISRDSDQQTLPVLENDSDRRLWYPPTPALNPELRVTSVTNAENGSVGIAEGGASVQYTPSAGFTGIDSFSYTITNADGETSEASVFVNVVEPLFALQDWFRVDEDSDGNELDVLRNDSSNVNVLFDGDPDDTTFQIVAVGQTSHSGSLSIAEDGRRLIYEPTEGFEGLESFSYTIEDQDGYQAEAMVQVQVTTIDVGSHEAWKEQAEQRLLEAAVQRAEGRFGSLALYPQWQYGSRLVETGTYNIDLGNQVFVDLDASVSLSFIDIADTDITSSNASLTATGASFSTTNVQVDGVDEGDVVKTDGKHLYVLSDWFDDDANTYAHQLIIVNVEDPADPAIVSRYEFEGDVVEQYLNGDRVTVLSQSGSDVVVTLLDISDRAAPTLLYESTIDGRLDSTRAIGDLVYVVANSFNVIQLPTLSTVCASEDVGCFYETKQQFVSRVEDNILDAAPSITTHDADGEIVETRGILEFSEVLQFANGDDWQNVSTIVTFDVGSDQVGPSASTAFSHAGTGEIYVSADAIYLLDQTWSDRSQTDIHKLSLDVDGGVSWTASGTVSGHVLNQFSVDEHDGYLRVATTSNWWGGDNNLYVLAQDGEQLEVVGSVEGLAPGERIYSARFDGERGFVVTYRKVDPLFVFDLSDPTNPEVLGALKVSGYSNYLQLIDENHLLGIGREANGGGLFQEMQVSLFDISDFDNPTLLHRYAFEGGRNQWSPIMADAWSLGTHHAVGYFASKQTLVMPVYDGDGSWWSWAHEGQTSQVSMRVLDIDIEDGITALGRVDFDKAFNPQHARAVRIGDVLYSISPETIKANELRSPENGISELFIGAGANDDSFQMRGTESARLDVLANDLFGEAEGEARRVVSVVQPRDGGQVMLNEEDGSVSLRVDEGFVGDVSFSYVLGVQGKYRNVGNVNVSVKPSWHNTASPTDIDGSGEIIPLDVLRALNAMSVLGRGAIDELEASASATDALMGGTLRLDTNNDGYFSPLDILEILNHLRNQAEALPTAEGEATLNVSRTDQSAKRIPADETPILAQTQPVTVGYVPPSNSSELARIPSRDVESLDFVLGLLDDELLRPVDLLT